MAHMSKADLSNDNFDAAYNSMMEVSGDGDRPLGVMPTHVMVGRSNRAKAKQVVKAMFGEGGKSNTNYEEVKLIVNPWLP